MGTARLVMNPYVNREIVKAPVFTSASFHKSIPGFVPTPLREAETAAKCLGVRSVHVKDESTRMGMPAFKILGASWATYRALMKHLGLSLGTVTTLWVASQVARPCATEAR